MDEGKGEAPSGGQGELTVLGDPHRLESDMNLIRRAVRERWPVAANRRPAVVDRLLKIVERETVDVPAGELTAELIRATPTTGVVVAVFTEQDTVARLDGAAFTAAEFAADPGAFRSIFAPTAGNLSILVNSVLWQPQAPRLLSVAELAGLQQGAGVGAGGSRLALIADLSCDIEGGIEATVGDVENFNFAGLVGAFELGAELVLQAFGRAAALHADTLHEGGERGDHRDKPRIVRREVRRMDQCRPIKVTR